MDKYFINILAAMVTWIGVCLLLLVHNWGSPLYFLMVWIGGWTWKTTTMGENTPFDKLEVWYRNKYQK